MARKRRPIEERFYDPLYENEAIRRQFWDRSSSSSWEHFKQIIRSYEFSRLHLIRQEGLTWLEFPAASHSRFAAALGCWYLADRALDSISVYPWERGESVLMRGRLEKLGWQEEFRLAVLLHDIGHFPFTLTIEANDFLREKYERENDGIDLVHEDFGIALMVGSHACNPDSSQLSDYERLRANKNRKIYESYQTFIQMKYGQLEDKEQNNEIRKKLYKEWTEEERIEHLELDQTLLISEILANLDREFRRRNTAADDVVKDVDIRKITYLLDPHPLANPPDLSLLDHADREFLRLVKNLVTGVLDLGHIDRYRRVSHIVGGIGQDWPQNWLFDHLAMILPEDDEHPGHFMVFDKGVDQLFEMLEDFHAARSRILHHPHRLAYEAMMNSAINAHWDHPKTTGNFRRFLPFMDDDQLFQKLRHSNSETCRKTVQRIRLQQPFQCIGWFHVPLGTSDAESDLCELQKQRRADVISAFACLQDKCLVRLTKSFGKPTRQERKRGKWNYRSDWLDLNDFCIGDSSFSDDRKHKTPVSVKSAKKEHVLNVEVDDLIQQPSFWVFALPPYYDRLDRFDRLQELIDRGAQLDRNERQLEKKQAELAQQQKATPEDRNLKNELRRQQNKMTAWEKTKASWKLEVIEFKPAGGDLNNEAELFKVERQREDDLCKDVEQACQQLNAVVIESYVPFLEPLGELDLIQLKSEIRSRLQSEDQQASK